MRQSLTPSQRIAKRFKRYDKAIRDIWEAYQFLGFYLPVLHDGLKREKVVTFQMHKLSGDRVHVKTNNALGVISHILQVVSPERSLVAALTHSEAFLQSLVTRVLRDDPRRLLGSPALQESPSRDVKLIEVIVQSADRSEMIEKMVEERVRGLFYGNPVEFFLKDKAKLGFGDYFATRLGPAVERYAEIAARRNVLIHNNGRVDRKYLREVPGSKVALRQRLHVDEGYLRDSLVVLRGLCAVAGSHVCDHIYGDRVKGGGPMSYRLRAFLALYESRRS